MTKFRQSKRVVSSVYGKSLTFYENKLEWRSHLSEACPRRCLQNRYSYKDFRRFKGNFTPVLDSVFNEVTCLQPTALLQMKTQYKCFPVNFVEYLMGISFL